jgi:hypothetical protein
MAKPMATLSHAMRDTCDPDLSSVSSRNGPSWEWIQYSRNHIAPREESEVSF